MRCGEHTLLREEAGQGAAITQYCKWWGCMLCEPINQARLAQKIIAGQFNHELRIGVNSRRLGSQDERAQELAKAVPKIFRRAEKKFKAKIAYFVVFHAHLSGEAHLHIPVRLPEHVRPATFKRWLSKQMADLIGAPHVHIQPIPNIVGRANYLSRKTVQFRGCKRFWSSHDWPIIRRVMKAVFDFSRAALNRIVLADSKCVERKLAAEGYNPRRVSSTWVNYTPP